MKTKLLQALRTAWLWGTDVPGWPDAPTAVRVRRILPVVVPCVAMLLLFAWQAVVFGPHRQRVRLEHAAVLALEDEIAALRLAYSEQQAAEAAERARTARSRVIAGAEQTASRVREFETLAREARWSGPWVVSELGAAGGEAGGPLVFKPVRARLAPAADNDEAFASLLRLLQQLPAGERRTDLTRVQVTADERGQMTVELNVRLAALPSP